MTERTQQQHDDKRRELSASIMGNWAMATTGRKDDIRKRDAGMLTDGKSRALTSQEYRKALIVDDFFALTGCDIANAGVSEVNNWIGALRGQGLAESTIAKRLALLSSFYKWLQRAMGKEVINPVELAERPKVEPYQEAKALPLDQARALLDYFKAGADTGDLAAVRDYALFMMFITTGRRRSEITRLKWGDLYLGEQPTMALTVKGGDKRVEEIPQEALRAVLAYVDATGRKMKAADPLWIRHDRAAKGNQAMSSWAFDKALKKAADAVGIPHVHIHQLRHTVATLVAEEGGEAAAQEQLGHKSIATTRQYLKAITVKRDRHSSAIMARLSGV